MLEVWREETSSPANFYSLDELSRKTKLAPPKLVEFVQFLKDEGAKASRTHFDPKGVKTDQSATELLGSFRRFARKR